MIDTAPPAKPPAPAIYALTIERFRGTTSLKCNPMAQLIAFPSRYAVRSA
jgi:hypothetical protein